MNKCYSLFLIIYIFYGCSDPTSPTELNYDSSINGENITIKINQQYTLELDSNFDGGYQWDYSLSDTEIMQIDSTSYRSKSGNGSQDGGLAIQTFYFSGKTKGICGVSLIEHRIWENDIPPINTVQFNVIVK